VWIAVLMASSQGTHSEWDIAPWMAVSRWGSERDDEMIGMEAEVAATMVATRSTLISIVRVILFQTIGEIDKTRGKRARLW
jgi:hypothetical protein